jgi:hypothetical protein
MFKQRQLQVSKRSHTAKVQQAGIITLKVWALVVLTGNN